MKKLTSLIIGCLVWGFASLQAQVVTVNASIDSLQILIGDQAKVKLQVALDSDKSAVFPNYKDTLIKGVEILEELRPDTQWINGGKRMQITRQYVVTSFDSALYYLPPMEVKVEDKSYKSNPLALKVLSIPVDTLHTDQFFGQKPLMDVPFKLSEWYGLMASIPAMVLLAWLIFFLVKKQRDDQPIIRHIKVEPKLPPHVVAMKEMELIKQERTWSNENAKEYYTKLTDTLRVYIKDRFGFNATEMTSSEIIDQLINHKDKEAVKELKELFQTADLVKFAKHLPLINEKDANLLSAIDFINETKEEVDPNFKPEAGEIIVEEKLSPREKKLLEMGIGASVLLFLFLLVYVIQVIKDAFF